MTAGNFQEPLAIANGLSKSQPALYPQWLIAAIAMTFDRHSSDRVGDRQAAENIARNAVGDRLGIDNPYSDIVEINHPLRTF